MGRFQHGRMCILRVADPAGIEWNGHSRRSETSKLYGGTRYKLQVSLPDGSSFVGVAEDGVDAGLEQGSSFPVKYDPLTKEVALVAMPKQAKAKEKVKAKAKENRPKSASAFPLFQRRKQYL